MKKSKVRKQSAVSKLKGENIQLKARIDYLSTALNDDSQRITRVRAILNGCGEFTSGTVEELAVRLVKALAEYRVMSGVREAAIAHIKDTVSRHTGNWPAPSSTETNVRP